MAYAAEASTSRMEEFVADTVPTSQPPSPHALVPSSSQAVGNHNGNATSRKENEVQLVPSSNQDAGSHSEGVAARKENEVTIPLTLPQSIVKSAHGNLPSTELLLQNYRNFTRRTTPSRLMYYENGDWLDFSSEAMDQLRPAFADHKAIVEVSINGSKYLFDFMRMLQIDSETKNCWSISWIDEYGKCFFPKVSIAKEGEYTEQEQNKNIESCVNANANASIAQKVDLVIKLDDSSLKRKRAEFEAIPSNPIMAFPTPPVSAPPVITRPVSTRPVSAPPINVPSIIPNNVPRGPRLVEVFRWPKTMILREGDKEHELIKDYFLSGIRKFDPAAKVTAIYKCTREGNLEKARYEQFQKQVDLTKAIRGDDVAKTIHAWHGASGSEVATLLTYGFQFPTKVPTADVYGVGVYLSPVGLAQLSADLAEADENGEKHIILCQLLLGNVEKVPFGSQQDQPSGVEYDIGSDDPNSPSWYVVWPCNMNKHILPEFVVSYQPTVNVRGKSKADPGWDEAMLSKVQGALPPAQFQEVLHLHKIYRAGFYTKDAFIKRLRLIVEDNILQTISPDDDA
ncbi:hypothetical protein SLEP1_g6878 [Rubroshorea leprosula]|uniref:Poly [ADP-ribose] polymerase n=1 Tax=Rubroshorea leprosula TaxID=152421 RepID=A0AAV5HWY7_9ROSI|nr:hypothetical protein SLEP1_g6878 [Rubroshorea leprosula]